MADFEFTGSGAQTSSCQDRIGEAYGIQQSNPPEPAQYGGAIVYHVVLTVDDLGCATANVTFSDICGMIHPWLLEGFWGTAQPQKSPRPPKPPKKDDAWELVPPEDYDDLRLLDPDLPKDPNNYDDLRPLEPNSPE